MPKPFDIVDKSQIPNLGRQPLMHVTINGIEAQLVTEVLAGQDSAEEPFVDDLQPFEREGIYMSALDDCINAFRLMRALRG